MSKWLRSIAALSLLAIPALLAACSDSNGAPTGAAVAGTGVVRTYYIAAEEVLWDYAPSGVNQIDGKPFANYTGTNAGSVFVMTQRVAFDPISTNANPANPNFTADPLAVQVGTVYKKTLFVEYTSASFTVKKPREAKWEHLGNLGPIIRAEVGDTIKVVFKNNTQTGRGFSMHPHGVFYTKPNEGSPYVGNDPDQFTAGNNVPPGGTWTYEWPVPGRAGPGPADGPSVHWMYHSHVDEVKDVYTGLHGPIIIYAKGQLRPDGTVVDIDREFVADFEIFNESESWLFEDNLTTFGKLSGQPLTDYLLGFDPETHLKHTINGLIFGNYTPEAVTLFATTPFTMKKGERVRWYLMAMGTEVDLHTPHWHGNTTIVNGNRVDVVSLLPAFMIMADMVPDNPGIWLFHCHVADHINAGMQTRYEVLP